VSSNEVGYRRLHRGSCHRRHPSRCGHVCSLSSALRVRAAEAETSDAQAGAPPADLPDVYLLVQRSDLVRIRYIFVYNSGPSRVSSAVNAAMVSRSSSNSSYHAAAREAGEQQTGLLQQTTEPRRSAPHRRISWSTVIIVAYAVLLVAVGLAQDDTRWRRMKRDVMKWIRL